MPEIINTVFDDNGPSDDATGNEPDANEETGQDSSNWFSFVAEMGQDSSDQPNFGILEALGGEFTKDAADHLGAEQSTGVDETGKDGESEGHAEETRNKEDEEEKAAEKQDRERYCEIMENETKYYGVKRREKTPEMEEEAFKIYRRLGMNKHNAVMGLMQADDEGIRRIEKGVDRVEETFESLPEEVRHDRMMGAWKKVGDIEVEFVRQHDSETMTDETVEDICDCIVDATKGGDKAYQRFRLVSEGIEAAGVGKNPRTVRAYYDFSKELMGTPEDEISGSEYHKKTSLIRAYARGHGLSAKNIEGFRKNVFPMIDAGDPEVECLMTASNSFGTSRGEFGIADFTIHSLVSEVNPRNVRDLMQIYREIPTSDYRRFEMNRKDAAALQGVLWYGRDFIHDQRPGIHELLATMIEFYDSRDDPEAHAEAKKRLEAVAEDRRDPKKLYGGFDGKMCLDIENYDKRLSGTRDSGTRTKTNYDDVPAIEVLRRLEENTRQVSLEKPKTGDEELDGLIDRLEVIEKDDGEVVVDFDEVATIVKRANEILMSRQGEIGMKPSMVKALSYIERMATAAMRGISKKDYRELPFDPGFKEIARFNELTASGRAYSEKDFEQFWSGFVSDFSKTWEDNPSEGYGVLSRRVTTRLHELAQQYKAEGKPRAMIDSLWSGNLSHELIGLVDSR